MAKSYIQDVTDVTSSDLSCITKLDDVIIYEEDSTWDSSCLTPKPNIIEIPIELPPVCPSRVLVFQICNSNAAKDDNFNVYLNDGLIGNVDLNYDTQIGSVFIASLDTPALIDGDFICPPENMIAHYFDPALVQSSNVIKMVNTQNNENGNQGSIGIRNYLKNEDGDLIEPCFIADLNYAGGSGESFESSFEYSDCCAERKEILTLSVGSIPITDENDQITAIQLFAALVDIYSLNRIAPFTINYQFEIVFTNSGSFLYDCVFTMGEEVSYITVIDYNRITTGGDFITGLTIKSLTPDKVGNTTIAWTSIPA